MKLSMPNQGISSLWNDTFPGKGRGDKGQFFFFKPKIYHLRLTRMPSTYDVVHTHASDNAGRIWTWMEIFTNLTPPKKTKAKCLVKS